MKFNIGTLYHEALKYDAELKANGKDGVLFAVIGKPTYPIPEVLKTSAIEYWSSLSRVALEYGDPAGEFIPRKQAAHALNREFKSHFDADDILFSVGGTMVLHAIFYALSKYTPNAKIVTSLPYYQAYTGNKADDFRNDLLLINTTRNNYQLTRELLESCLSKKEDKISAFLFCDPCNPTGQVLGETWLELAPILREYPDSFIILDESYAEMVFIDNAKSLLGYCPDLQDRVIIVRSATKGLSASGERLALLGTKNKKLYDLMLNFTFSHYVHSPISGQYIYANALDNVGNEYYDGLRKYYGKRIKRVHYTLKEKGLNLTENPPEGGFYNLINMNHYIGNELHSLAEKKLGKSKIENDEDIIFDLLYRKCVALAPLSYFGVDPSLGHIRITCSDDIEILDEIVRRISDD